ncbi:multidrug resistance protein MdtA [Sideroxyarcus emersonii]|uniref:Multidrug resistance protein MdtA n=1 Tax=Sideroxyarcus emersonii TaxID=2764705 RepID=A0AAN2BZR5_9PROT|nr:efflux RND transporter periplasmic adaptor subunit [Sideroxyarcus emersonii]BCK88403.1 multidrug resistance protein MdtA [Sideroxyarcus emersonii]
MSDNHPQPALSGRRLRLAGGIFAAVAVTIAVVGIYMRIDHANDLEKAVESQHVTVKVVSPQFGPSTQELILPGNVRADLDAPIYARVSGYLKTWETDIGARVKKGQLLGEIETPELDQQIMRARADVASAQSNWEIADVTAKRWQNLVASDSVSRQESDEKTADAKSKRDILNAAKANLDSLLASQSFQRIVAPFDGVVTERNTDIGKLINPGSNNGQALFRVVDNRRLRIYTEVPQSFAYLIKQKMPVKIYFPELPGQPFTASVLSTANAIRESSRTTTVELLMDNKNGKVFSGSYAEVHFDLPSSAQIYRLPVSALLFRKDGLEVATVGPDNRVVLKSITLARDLGRVVEVSSGIESSDRVIDSPNDSIVQGDIVRIQGADAQAGDHKKEAAP